MESSLGKESIPALLEKISSMRAKLGVILAVVETRYTRGEMSQEVYEELRRLLISDK